MKREYPFSSSDSPAADVGQIARFPTIDCETYREQTIGNQMADPNSLLYFPSLVENQRDLNQAVQASSMLACTFDTVVQDERDEAVDFSVFGRVLLVALALAELTLSFSERADLAGQEALVGELRKRMGRVNEQLDLVVDGQCDQLLDTMNS